MNNPTDYKKLTDKDMSVLREGDKTKDQRDKRHGIIRDYGLHHRVEVRWDLNDEAIRDKIFLLTVDDYEVLLDAEEMMRYLRWV